MVALAFAALAGLATEPARTAPLPRALLAAVVLTGIGAAFPPARFVDPRALVEASLAIAPEQPELHVLEGEMLLHEIAVTPPGRQEALGKAALAAAERALRVRPGDAGALALRSLAHALHGRLDEARAASDRLLALHPDDWRSLVARAEIESVAGDDVAASVAALGAAVPRRRAVARYAAAGADLRDGRVDSPTGASPRRGRAARGSPRRRPKRPRRDSPLSTATPGRRPPSGDRRRSGSRSDRTRRCCSGWRRCSERAGARGRRSHEREPFERAPRRPATGEGR